MAKTSKKTTNPFSSKQDLSDLALIVEGKKLHAHKMHLALYSPVFKSMFYSEFREKNTDAIELPEKKHDDMVEFLRHLYPVHSLKPVTDDTLLAVLSLAEEYQVDHVLNKGRLYIQEKLKMPWLSSYRSPLSIDQQMLYLCVCDRCQFQEERQKLERELCSKTPNEIADHPMYDQVDHKLMRDIMCRLCRIKSSLLEDERNVPSCSQSIFSRTPCCRSSQLGKQLETARADANGKQLQLETARAYLKNKQFENDQLRQNLERRDSLLGKVSLFLDGSMMALMFYFALSVISDEVIARLW